MTNIRVLGQPPSTDEVAEQIRATGGGGTGGKAGDQEKFWRETAVTCTQWQGETLIGLDRIREAENSGFASPTRGRSRMR